MPSLQGRLNQRGSSLASRREICRREGMPLPREWGGFAPARRTNAGPCGSVVLWLRRSPPQGRREGLSWEPVRRSRSTAVPTCGNRFRSARRGASGSVISQASMHCTMRWALSSSAPVGVTHLSGGSPRCCHVCGRRIGLSLSTRSTTKSPGCRAANAVLKRLYASLRGPQATTLGIRPSRPAFERKLANALRQRARSSRPSPPPSTYMHVRSPAVATDLARSPKLPEPVVFEPRLEVVWVKPPELRLPFGLLAHDDAFGHVG